MRRGIIVGMLMLMGVAALAGTLIVRSAAQPPAESESASTPEAVVRQAVEDTGDVYAGPCAETRSPEDIGKVCATLIGEREGDGLRAYLTGRTFSEYSQWVFIAPDGDAWRLIGTAPLDFFSESEEIPWPE